MFVSHMYKHTYVHIHIPNSCHCDPPPINDFRGGSALTSERTIGFEPWARSGTPPGTLPNRYCFENGPIAKLLN